MIDQIEKVLYLLRTSDSKNPMDGKKLANLLDMTQESFQEMMQIICNILPAPVNRSYIEKSDFKGYVYWPTGVVDKVHWKEFKVASPQQPSQPIRTEISAEKVSEDKYAPPALVQSAEPDYSDKPKAYQILKYIEAHPGTTSKPIEQSLGLTASIKPYISGYLDREDVISLNSANGRIYRVTRPVEEFYGHSKSVSKKQPGETKSEATPMPEQPQEAKATHTMDAQTPAAKSQGSAMPEVQEATAQNHKTQVEHDHPGVVEDARYRFAYSNDGCLMLMTFGHLPIELNRRETQLLISFLDDQLTLIGLR